MRAEPTAGRLQLWSGVGNSLVPFVASRIEGQEPSECSKQIEQEMDFSPDSQARIKHGFRRENFRHFTSTMSCLLVSPCVHHCAQHAEQNTSTNSGDDEESTAVQEKMIIQLQWL